MKYQSRWFAVIAVFYFYWGAGLLYSQIENIKEKLVIPDSTEIQVLTTSDGSRLVGRISKIGDSNIQFETENGILTIAISNIRDIRTEAREAVKEGQYWFPNPNQTRLYFSPTGRMLGKGEGYFASIYLFFNGFAYALTDNFTLGAGMSLIPWVALDNQVYFLTPKIGLAASENISFAAGALILAIPDFDTDSDNPVVGILFGAGTFGPPDRSFTLGVGYGFEDRNLADQPAVILGADLRLSRTIAFVTENFLFPGIDEPIISYGIRFFGEKLSVDLSLFNSLGDEAVFPGLPYIDFVVNF